MNFLNNISLEIYLSHMFIFRCIEIVGLNKILGNGWIQYIFTVLSVLICTVIFAWLANYILNKISKIILNSNRSESNTI